MVTRWPYGYARLPFALLKGDGAIATFDDVTNATKTVSDLSFNSVTAVKFAASGAVTADCGISSSNLFTQPAEWSGGIQCAVYLEDVSKITSVTLYLGTSNYGTFYTKALSGAALISGWNIIAVTAREFNAGGGSMATTMQRTKLRVITTAATNWHIAYFSHYQRPRAKVLVVCDDGYDEHYTYLKDIMIARSIPCTFSIDTSYIGTAGFMTQSQVQSLHDDASGLFTIANHGLNNESLSGVGVTAYMLNVTDNRTVLDGWNCTNGRNLHVYVQGGFSDALVNELKSEGFISAREVGSSDRTAKTATEQIVDSVAMMLPASCNLENTQTLATVRGYLANAITDGGTFVIMGHRFDPSSAGSIQWTEADMTALMDDLKRYREQGLIDTPSWPDWYLGLTQPTLV